MRFQRSLYYWSTEREESLVRVGSFADAEVIKTRGPLMPFVSYDMTCMLYKAQGNSYYVG